MEEINFYQKNTKHWKTFMGGSIKGVNMILQLNKVFITIMY